MTSVRKEGERSHGEGRNETKMNKNLIDYKLLHAVVSK